MKATILEDPERPKARREDVQRMLHDAGIGYSMSQPDFGIVVGGDGIFSHYGRVASIPLLFVSVRSQETTSSKGYLAEVNLDGLADALARMKRGAYQSVEYRKLSVSIGGTKVGDVFTDAYLEKGADSNCLRYHLRARGHGIAFTESAIANGVIVCTSAGSTGYYSYVDKLQNSGSFKADRFTQVRQEEIGVCHIAPVFTQREGSEETPLRYTLPWSTNVRLTLTRDADARLFGLTRSRKGIRIRTGDFIDLVPSDGKTKVIKLSKEKRKRQV